MFTMVIIRAEILCIGIILYLIGYSLYCSRYHHIRSNFLFLAFTCLIHSVFALVTELTVNNPTCPVIVNNICHILFFAFAQLFCLELFRYTLALVAPGNRTHIPTAIAGSVCLTGLVCACISPIKYLEGKGTFYSAGIGPSICFGTGVILFIAIVIILIVNLRKVQQSVIFALLPITTLAFIGELTQVIIPEFLFTSGTLTLALIGAFFAIENPIGKFEDRANIDLDTQARNRNSYERDFADIKKRIKSGKINFPFMYVICDINGLKTVNDNYGHLEGDKLILAAAEVLMDKLKSSSNVYRIGGDEFGVFYEGVRIGDVEAEIASIPEACEKVSLSKKLISPLSISTGYGLYTEGGDLEDLVRIADERMYKNKDAFYRKKGINRRKVQDYASVFRDGATKILKINLTDDSFNIFKVDLAEKKKEEGYSENFSEWVKGFIKAGYVHESSRVLFDDKVDIAKWKKFFDDGGSKISFIYKRRYDKEFYQSYVEIVRGNEYHPDKQIIFLFVKNLEIK